MKKILLVTIVLFGMASCQTDDLETLKAKKDELKSTISEAETKLAEVEEKIKGLDDQEEVDYPDVTVAKVNQTIFEHYITIPGLVEAENSVMVTPEVGGVISSLNVKEGDVISEGSTIVSFSSKDISSSKAEIETQLEVAEKLLAKQQKLYDQGLGNVIQLDQSKGQVASLKQALKTLNVQGGKFHVKAPFTGRVETVYVVKGQVAGPTSPLILLVDNKDRKVVAQMSETYLKNVEVGSKVDVEFGVLGKTISGLKVSRIGGYIDPVNRTLDMEIKLPNFSDKYVPNLMANINVRDEIDSNALVIPSKVILKGSDQSSYVFVLEKNEEKSDSIARYDVVKKTVELGSMYQGFTVVTNGLLKGDKVINRGKSDVYEGSVVEISEL